jgi:hypothetical protein
VLLVLPGFPVCQIRTVEIHAIPNISAFSNRHRSTFGESSRVLSVASDFAAPRTSVGTACFRNPHSDTVEAKYLPPFDWRPLSSTRDSFSASVIYRASPVTVQQISDRFMFSS